MWKDKMRRFLNKKGLICVFALDGNGEVGAMRLGQ